ncbi:hypothetical protein MMC10_000418 [Thelotrema lepadinum]|nr:hypothetical protein [Thelotrema lepadinum]
MVNQNRSVRRRQKQRFTKAHLARERAKLLQAREKQTHRDSQRKPSQRGELFNNKKILENGDFLNLRLSREANEERSQRIGAQIEGHKAFLANLTDGSLQTTNSYWLGRIIDDLRWEEQDYRDTCRSKPEYNSEWLVGNLLWVRYIKGTLKLRVDMGWYNRQEMDYDAISEWMAEERERMESDLDDWVKIWTKGYLSYKHNGTVHLDENDWTELREASLLIDVY